MTTPATAEFTELRFRSNADALQVVSAIQSLVDCPLGAAFRAGDLEAVILRGPVEWEPVLYFSRGARAASRLSGIRLPQSNATVLMDQSRHASLLVKRQAEELRESGGAEGGPMRVLVVEDHLDTARMLEELLKAWGFSAAIAHSGAEALEVAERFMPRVVLLDLGLPDQHGYWVAQKLRQEMHHKHLSFVAVTGWSPAADQQLSNSAGISHHLVKPVNPDALRSILERLQQAA